MEALLDRLLAAASARMAICDYMSEALEQRYGVSFLSFQNAVDVARWRNYAKHDVSIGREIRLLYTGSIYPNAQLDSLVDCCQAVATLRKQGMPARFDIYSPSFLAERYRRRLVIDEAVTLNDTIADDERFFSELAKADVLILPVNFDENTVQYIRYSMPTKIPAYLVSGTPILVYGPQAVAQVRYAQEAGWGHVVCRKGVEYLIQGLRELGGDGALRETLSRTAKATAQGNHDTTDVRRRFQSALCQASSIAGNNADSLAAYAR